MLFEILATGNAIFKENGGDSNFIEPGANVGAFVLGCENAIASPGGYDDGRPGGLGCRGRIKCDGGLGDVGGACDSVVITILDLFFAHLLVLFARSFSGPEWQSKEFGVGGESSHHEEESGKFHIG